MDRRNSGPVARLLRQYSTALDDGRNGARDHEQVFTDPVQLARAVATKPNLDAVGGCDGGSYQLGAIPPVRALAQHSEATRRSEERSVGKECVSTCRSRWSPDH